jgi:hypothetical protein
MWLKGIGLPLRAASAGPPSPGATMTACPTSAGNGSREHRPWQEDAACAGFGSEPTFPHVGGLGACTRTTYSQRGDMALELDPSWALGYWISGLAYAQQGRYDEAREALRSGSEQGCLDCRRDLGPLSVLAGRHGEAREILGTLAGQWSNGRARHAAFDIASIHMALGEREQALNWLEQAVEPDWLEQAVEPSRRMLYLRIDPTFRPLHGEPRFQALLKELRLE